MQGPRPVGRSCLGTPGKRQGRRGREAAGPRPAGGVLDRGDLLPAPPHRSRLLRPLEWAAAAPWWPQGPTASLAYNPHRLRPSDSPRGFSQACHLRPSHAAFLTPLFGPRSRAALRRTQAVCPPMTPGAVPLCKQPGDRGHGERTVQEPSGCRTGARAWSPSGQGGLGAPLGAGSGRWGTR